MTISDIRVSEQQPRTLGLLLLDGFPLMAYASVIEPYRAVNTLAGRELYRWCHISRIGAPVNASNGAIISADHAVGEAIRCDVLFVFAGGDPTRFSDRHLYGWLRRVAADGTVVVGISAGPFILAQAGLLDGYQATIHWEHRTAFAEAFPAVGIEPGLYVIDRRRVTCAGGMAGMDLAIELIEREQGQALAARVSDWFIRSWSRSSRTAQRLSLRDRYGVTNDSVLKALAHMESAVEEPAPRDAIAAVAGVSLRQLERLFAQHLGETISEAYVRIRLEQAEQLLRSTAMSVTDVALACGFFSASHFSRRFRKAFGHAPSKR